MKNSSSAVDCYVCPECGVYALPGHRCNKRTYKSDPSCSDCLARLDEITNVLLEIVRLLRCEKDTVQDTTQAN